MMLLTTMKAGANMASEAQRRAVAKYDKENTTQIKFKLNKKTDADIIEYLKTIENRSQWFKDIVRAEIKGDT